jgi:predicted peroxiredoxin
MTTTIGRPPLLLIASTADAERLRGALTLACAEAALGGGVSLFLLLDAVLLLKPPVEAPHDEAHAACGLPRMCALIDDALDLGVQISVCQSGLTLARMEATELDPRISASGPVAVLSETCAETRVLLV